MICLFKHVVVVLTASPATIDSLGSALHFSLSYRCLSSYSARATSATSHPADETFNAAVAGFFIR